MRLHGPMIGFAISIAIFFTAWRYLHDPFAMWLCGVSSGAFFICVLIESMGWIIGKPIWLTSKND